MTRLPMEQTGESATVDSQRSIPMPMPSLMKMYQLVDDPSSDDLISWNEDGTSFIIYRPAEFGRDLLPKYFKHLNFSSFVRQLKTHGFRKVVPDRWEFANDGFQRGLLRFVQQLSLAVPVVTTPMATVNTVTVNPSLIAALEEENERLRKENMQLCNELLALMSKYGSRFGKAALEYFILCHEHQWLELGI